MLTILPTNFNIALGNLDYFKENKVFKFYNFVFRSPVYKFVIVDDVTNGGFRDKEKLFPIFLWLLEVVDFDAKSAFIRHHPLIQRKVLGGYDKAPASFKDILQH